METKFTLHKIEVLLEHFSSSLDGLTPEQVKERQERDGFNEIAVGKISIWVIFLKQYANFLMLLLFFGALLSIALGEWVDGLVIAVIFFLNGILGTIQEYKAEKLTKALNAHIPQSVTVRRNSKEMVVLRKDLVCGDIVLLASGQLVPADLRILKNFGVVVDETMLTGESIGVAKHAKHLEAEPKNMTEMSNILFNGTVILEGSCEGIVIAISNATEFGKIVSFAQHTKKRSTFLRQVNGLSDFLFKVTLLISGLLFIVLAIFKPELGTHHAFLFAIALAIAIVPEMLPLISTIALTRASLMLAKRGVLIKRLSSLEDLGGVEILCTDKTGTLTKNILEIVDVFADDQYECMKHALIASKKTGNTDFVLAGSFDSAIYKKTDPKLATEVQQLRNIWSGSFDPQFRWQFTVVTNGMTVLAVKGAPETILERTSLSLEQKHTFLSQSSNLGTLGLRVLAVAKTEVEEKDEYSEEDVSDLDFLGLIVFEDPIKSTASAALQMAEALGVKIKLLTGDAPEVALQVARQAGMQVEAKEVLTGYDIRQVSSELRDELISHAKIFARVNPHEKYQIMQVFNKKHSVMFLGEGINDAPAIKAADVGMVVQEASDIAKETADIILTKSDLKIIIESIYLGRQIMCNIAKYILITLTGNFGSLYAISLLSILAPVLPLLPTQILLENILTDVPMVSIINNPVLPREQRRPFRQNIREIGFAATMLGFATLFIQVVFYQMFRELPTDLFRTIWLVEIILLEFALIISLRTTDWFWEGGRLATNTTLFFAGVVVTTIALPFIPFVSNWFHLQPYNLGYLLPICVLILVGVFIVELMKKFLFRERIVSLA